MQQARYGKRWPPLQRAAPHFLGPVQQSGERGCGRTREGAARTHAGATKITAISNLESVPALRVLMLGKNRITRIRCAALRVPLQHPLDALPPGVSGLESLVRLDVLDLHSNLISAIEGLSTLTSLRVLNVAGTRTRRRVLPCALWSSPRAT